MLFAPLPVLERIPVSIRLVGRGRLISRFFGRLARAPVRAAVPREVALPEAILARLDVAATRFAFFGFAARSDGLLRGVFSAQFLVRAASERGFQVEVGAEIVVRGGGVRSARVGRDGPAFGPSRFALRRVVPARFALARAPDRTDAGSPA